MKRLYTKKWYVVNSKAEFETFTEIFTFSFKIDQPTSYPCAMRFNGRNIVTLEYEYEYLFPDNNGAYRIFPEGINE